MSIATHSTPVLARRARAKVPDAKGGLRKRTFSQDLRALAEEFKSRPATLAGILAATQGRGFDLLLFLLALPFLTPIPLLGLSTPFGLVVFLIGMRLAFGRQPWLPRRLLERELPSGFLIKVLGAASRLVRWLEFLLRPRLGFFHEQTIYRRTAGTLIMLSGLLLLLPLPIPLTNSLPALTVVLLAAGALERDGLFFLAGCVAFAVAVAYFGLLAFGGAHVVDELRHRLLGA
jgi:hypothetical protein